MSEFVRSAIHHRIGVITLDRPKALNSLSLDMVRELIRVLLAWRDDDAIEAVMINSSSDKAFCAGGDIRFFYRVGQQPPQHGSLLIEDFFTEEYSLNYLIHHYPKPYIAFMDGIVMGGGMGISQCFSAGRMRIVTERTKMAMPEVNIGLFPDIGAGFFLSRCPGQIGAYLALTGQTIGAADALYAGLADIFIPSGELPNLKSTLLSSPVTNVLHTVRRFAEQIAVPDNGFLARERAKIDQHFNHGSATAIQGALAEDTDAFSQETLSAMQKRSPLMMCVALEQIRRAANMTIGECLRMERSMMRHCFEGSEALEGIRAAVIDKDQSPKWKPASLAEVTPEMVAKFFIPAWPDYIHPLRIWL
ncbi:MAG: enoyl-CoA hydratase/isomerase family protein [Burkholderiales bacterium]|nr:enoyl-CoA hydratase/isomerase family protein [Burkholderiales bacterium]